MDRDKLKLEIRNLAQKYGRRDGGLSTIGKRKVSLVLGELLKEFEALEARIEKLDKRTKKRPVGRPRKVKVGNE
jgi:hypothetical protein